MKWYTAIGIKENRNDRKFHVKVGKYEDKVLAGMEIFLWTSLLWVFAEENEIFGRMTKLLQLSLPEKKEIDLEEYKYCFRRLCTRGLVISCEGDTKESAAEELLRVAAVELTTPNFHDRYIQFLTSVVHGNTIRFSSRAFKRKPLEKRYKKLLERMKKQGDISFYIEEIQVEGRNLGQDTGEICGRQKSFLEIVMELYREKIITIRAINRGGAFEEYSQ